MCVLISSTTYLKYLCVLIGLHVKYPLFLSGFNEALFFSADFLKIRKYQILWKSALWVPGGRTNMKLIVDFRSFANAPKT
jgi:hypothetical protein